MANNKEAKRESHNDLLDEHLIDPQLRSDTAKSHSDGTRAHSPTLQSIQGLSLASDETAALTPTPLREELRDRSRDDYPDTYLPKTAYTSLDFVMDSLDQRNENERIWLIGLQAGIGLGIDGAREAVLNEMQWENTVFQRPLQQSPSDPDPQQLRMEIGQSCLTGFDRRVAYRMANRFLGTCGQLADIVVQHGLTTCLPETGCHVMGTSMFFSADDVARCHENSQLINEAAEPALAESQLNSGMDHDFNVEQLISPTTSFVRDGTSSAVHPVAHAESNEGDLQTEHKELGKGEEMPDKKPRAKRSA